eukprot:TRINITY_DN16335_c0_g1_i1.p1 TRINITY_DN16335_c0_g1~~TRINITY_DN16335_c0_g1_i1.p1  ORF type:complete len:404 (-),score=60.84 TRINITY_DN16335_c0_g1_i1:186-1397(-)
MFLERQSYSPVHIEEQSSSIACNSKNVSSTARAPVVNEIECLLRNHALLTWFLFPALASLLANYPPLEISCETGYPNWTLIVVAAVEVHHMYAESRIWSALKSLQTEPEIIVMRHLGVLRRRRLLVVVGLLESIVLYTDIVFPLVARSCDEILTERWHETWKLVPLLGRSCAHAILVLRFWGCALVISIIVVLVNGLLGLARMVCCFGKVQNDEAVTCMVLLEWANAAEAALMPSVALMCEEWAQERRYVFATDRDTRNATKAREDVAFGKLDRESAIALEAFQQDVAAHERMAEMFHFLAVLIFKVFVGKCLQIWMRASFLALTFDSESSQAKIKVAVSCALSALLALHRVFHSHDQLGCAGLPVMLLIVGILAWAGAKVYFAYHCDSHLWNLTTGCAKLPN